MGTIFGIMEIKGFIYGINFSKTGRGALEEEDADDA